MELHLSILKPSLIQIWPVHKPMVFHYGSDIIIEFHIESISLKWSMVIPLLLVLLKVPVIWLILMPKIKLFLCISYHSENKLALLSDSRLIIWMETKNTSTLKLMSKKSMVLGIGSISVTAILILKSWLPIKGLDPIWKPLSDQTFLITYQLPLLSKLVTQVVTILLMVITMLSNLDMGMVLSWDLFLISTLTSLKKILIILKTKLVIVVVPLWPQNMISKLPLLVISYLGPINIFPHKNIVSLVGVKFLNFLKLDIIWFSD